MKNKILSSFKTTILDIKSVDFLQFLRYFMPPAKLEEAFIIHKPIDFSYRLKTYMVIWSLA